MARPEVAQDADQTVAVVVGMGHQVPAAHVEPFDPAEQVPEALLDGFERPLQMLGARFAQDMEVQPLDACRELAEQFGRNAQARARDAGVVEVGFDGRIAGVDPHSAREAVDEGPLSEASELAERVEGDVAAAAQDFVEVAVAVCGGVGVGRSAELLQDEPGLGRRRSRGAVGVRRQLGKDRPHGARLEGDDHFGARFAAHAVNRREVGVEQFLVEDVAGRRQGPEVDHGGWF